MSKTAAPVELLVGGEEIEEEGSEPGRVQAAATKRLRGLWRLLPLPWAKTTSPEHTSGTVR